MIQYRETNSLRPYKQNARTHSKKQIRQIADSIRKFGFTNPLLISRDGEITEVTAGSKRPSFSAWRKCQRSFLRTLRLKNAELRFGGHQACHERRLGHRITRHRARRADRARARRFHRLFNYRDRHRP